MCVGLCVCVRRGEDHSLISSVNKTSVGVRQVQVQCGSVSTRDVIKHCAVLPDAARLCTTLSQLLSCLFAHFPIKQRCSRRSSVQGLKVEAEVLFGQMFWFFFY